MSAARHAQGQPAPAAYEARAATRSPALPLLIMVLGLAIATIWFVALPMLDQAGACETHLRGDRPRVRPDQVRHQSEDGHQGGAPEGKARQTRKEMTRPG